MTGALSYSCVQKVLAGSSAQHLRIPTDSIMSFLTEATRHDKRVVIVTLYTIGKQAPEIHRYFACS